MIIIGYVLISAMVGVLVYGLCDVLSDGAEDVANRFLGLFRKKRIGLLSVSNAIRKP